MVFNNNFLVKKIIIYKKGGDTFDLDDLIDQFLTFFIAGQETTANSLAFAILELGRNPEAFLKLNFYLNFF